MATPTKPAMIPVTMRIRWFRVAETICTYSPIRIENRPVAVAMMTHGGAGAGYVPDDQAEHEGDQAEASVTMVRMS